MLATTPLVGSVRRFGADGVLYVVVREINATVALIHVIDTGEETTYPIGEIRNDPIE